MARQLAFDLPVRPALGRGDFFVAPPNALALALVEAPERWPQGKLLILGPAGAGKSHLAAVWAGAAGAVTIMAKDLGEDRVPNLLSRASPAVLVEDADRLAGDPGRETALFHLHNLILADGGQLLMTARTEPRLWGLTLPDLQSRVEATAIARFDPPDDALLAAVLLKQFTDRQIALPPTLIPYLLGRMDRSFAAARDLVAGLDRLALSMGRPVTRALAALYFDQASGRGSPGAP